MVRRNTLLASTPLASPCRRRRSRHHAATPRLMLQDPSLVPVSGPVPPHLLPPLTVILLSLGAVTR